jgi:hypothetical protein
VAINSLGSAEFTTITSIRTHATLGSNRGIMNEAAGMH